MTMTPRSSLPETRLPGTRPEGIETESEAAAHVREMFGRIAPRYDLLNHLLSLDIDKVWRRRVAKELAPILRDPAARVLDLCCGTGDLAFAFFKFAPNGARIIGSDFVPEMLVRARAKAIAMNAPVEFVEADALQLPFPDQTFDLVSCAFGFRNLANYERGIQEIHRVLKPGCSVGILEFAEPPGAVFGAVYRFYFRHILPRLGGMISGNSAAYSYLPRSVSNFPAPEELKSRFEEMGFVNVKFTRWTGGIVTLHVARRPI
jgi:demethylmenaquinone methyltransferase / 2-methoxy-6-polyprenyl-1,4-benzoquinol methylase